MQVEPNNDTRHVGETDEQNKVELFYGPFDGAVLVLSDNTEEVELRTPKGPVRYVMVAYRRFEYRKR